uniref:Secreted protein n=1 Tax=Sus scrofa TaxID=9823 RepID=A0A4X1T5V0_PIG
MPYLIACLCLIFHSCNSLLSIHSLFIFPRYDSRTERYIINTYTTYLCARHSSKSLTCISSLHQINSTLWGQNHPHFTDEESEAHRSNVLKVIKLVSSRARIKAQAVWL